MEREVDNQVAAPAATRTPNLHRANKIAHQSADGRVATVAHSAGEKTLSNKKTTESTWLRPAFSWKAITRLSYERGCQEKKLLPAPLGDAEVVTYIQPHLIPHLILRGVIGLVALARRTSPRRCQPQLLVPTRGFHEVSGARRRSVAKLRKL